MKQRTIKFKAKRLDNGEWVEGDLYHNLRGFDICICQRKKDDVYAYPINPSTICQYTGLKDNGGAEIWEHDILENYPYLNGEVLLYKGCWVVDGKNCHVPLYEYISNDNLEVVKLTNNGSKFDQNQMESYI